MHIAFRVQYFVRKFFALLCCIGKVMIPREHEFPQTPTMHGVRTDRYKYIRYHGVWDTNEFYDLANEPDERHNLIASPEHQETIKQLNHELYDWLESTDGMRIPLKRTERPHTDHRNQGYY